MKIKSKWNIEMKLKIRQNNNVIQVNKKLWNTIEIEEMKMNNNIDKHKSEHNVLICMI